jgi:hypothetical protein
VRACVCVIESLGRERVRVLVLLAARAPVERSAAAAPLLSPARPAAASTTTQRVAHHFQCALP